MSFDALYFSFVTLINFKTTTNFLLTIQIKDKNVFFYAKIGYLCFSKSLSDSQLIYGVWQPINYAPNCDGTNALTICPRTYNLGFSLPSMDYKLIINIQGVGAYRNPNFTILPTFGLSPVLTNLSLINLNQTADRLKIMWMDFSLLIIQNSLFDPTKKQTIMFTYQRYSNKPTTQANFTFDLSLPINPEDNNFIFGISSQYGGWSFTLFLNNPQSSILHGKFHDIGRAMNGEIL